MKTNLELYILSLVRNGVATPYELNSRAGLSLGSTVPALARLESESLIKGSEPQSRNSRRYLLTSKGLRLLQREWREQLTEETTDLDSILRITYLARQYGTSEAAAEYLSKAGNRLHARANSLKSEAERFGGPDGWVKNDAFRSLRARIESRRLMAAADEIALLAKELLKSGRDEPAKTKKKKKRS
ncbi:MAG: PadR family transcriptional regulator [Terriglobia bacterium]|nr:PadR family transcriptional regulator [Terriglobia bacterium]